MSRRKATHAGTWYNNSDVELSRELEYWLNQSDFVHGPARAIISPHAGYEYCGACASSVYKQINPDIVQQIFILGPSHRVRLSGCFLSDAQKYETPFYDLQVNSQTIKELQNTGEFENIDLHTDENEHSVEMQLPYIAKVMENYKNQFTIVPVLVGIQTPETELKFGKIFSSYLADPKNLFIISSDFCHWGKVFNYTYYDTLYGEIYESTEQLDRMGMNIIETLNPAEFRNYLEKYKNTICGRFIIAILLEAIQELLKNDNILTASMKFLKYMQSEQCRTLDDTSVSYAAAALVIN